VPPVSVILLLRKFSSRVYGQQVVGRGLRLNMRGEDAQEICAIVDHEKLRHGWLWKWSARKLRQVLTKGICLHRRRLAAQTEATVRGKARVANPRFRNRRRKRKPTSTRSLRI